MKLKMKFKISLLLFLIGGLGGFLLDVAYRSAANLAWSHQGFLTTLAGFPVPFLPVYGFGLLIIYLLQPLMSQRKVAAKFLLYAIILSALEFIGGSFAELMLDVKLWDYSYNLFNFLGYADLLHAAYWGMLGLATFYFFAKYPPEGWL